jgi:hypothetical protein
MIKSDMPKREIRFHIDRYLKKNSLPLTASQLDIKPIYAPYWKIDAVVLKVRNTIIERTRVGDDYNNYTGYGSYDKTTTYEQKITDIRLVPFTATQIAFEAPDEIPHTLGMRTEYIKMVPFSRENIGEAFTCIPTTRTWEQALKDMEKTIAAMGGVSTADFGKNRTEYFHPVGSIVYFPYFIVDSPYDDESRQFIIDGVSGRIIKYASHPLYDAKIEYSDLPEIVFGELSVEFHRCPNCGVDLPSEQSFVYICDNCNELVMLEKYPFVVDNIVSAQAENRSNDRMFPFWSLKLSGHDQMKLKRMFGGIYGSDRLVIPGFKLPNFEAMFRLAKRISAAVARIDFEPVEKMDNHFISVSLSLTEALTLAEVIIYRESISKGMNNSYRETEFHPIKASLFYAPFHPESYFYVDSVLGAVTFEKNLVE